MSDGIYRSWRDKLLWEIGERICKPCTDPRKEKYAINYGSPLECGCRCKRVNGILDCAGKIDEDIENGP